MTFRANFKAWRELGSSRRRAARRAWEAGRDRRALARRNAFAGPGPHPRLPAGTSLRSLGPAFELEYRSGEAQRDVYRRWRRAGSPAGDDRGHRS